MTANNKEFERQHVEPCDETWRDIPGWVGFYQVSNSGRVRSLNRVVQTSTGQKRTIPAKVLRPKHGTDDYLFVSLYKDGTRSEARTHRLVALAFLGDPPNRDYDVHHKNGIKTDNRPANLEYIQGLAHRSIHNRGGGNGNATLTVRDVMRVRAMLTQGLTNTEIAAEFGVSHSTISCIRRGRTWKHLPSIGMLVKGRAIDAHYSLANTLKLAA